MNKKNTLLTILIILAIASITFLRFDSAPSKPAMLRNIGHFDLAQPTVIIGNRQGDDRSSALHLTYPEAAVMDSAGRIFIANALAPSVEMVEAEGSRTVLRGREQLTTKPTIYVDLRLTSKNTLLVVDAGANEILELDQTNAVLDVIKGPGGDGKFHYISSVDEQDGKLLVSARPAKLHGQFSYASNGESALYVRNGEHWTLLADASKVGFKGEGFRDAVFLSDGRVAAVIGTWFVVFDGGEVSASTKIGGAHGGGILEFDEHWLVGCYSNIVSVRKSNMVVSKVKFPAPFANVGHLHLTKDGRLLVTDTDRQTIYVQDYSTGRLIGRIGNTGESYKFVSLGTRNRSVYLLENTNPRLLRYDLETGDLFSVAGDGEQGYEDAQSAASFSFMYPTDLAINLDGAVYVSEANNRIVRVNDGKVEIFAGNTKAGSPKEGEHRLNARFRSVRGLSFAPNGDLFIADQGNHTIWRISSNDRVYRVMGNGKPGLWESGKRATTQPLNTPSAVLARRDGTLLISDSYNNAVVMVDADGIVHSFAGIPKPTVYQGLGAYSGDGSHAVEAELNTPMDIMEDGSGYVYIVDQFNSAVRRVSPAGIIETVFGGHFGYSGDGSRMNLPKSVAVMNDGMFVADTGNGVVWGAPLPAQ